VARSWPSACCPAWGSEPTSRCLATVAGHRGRGEGAYFGWWNFATKLNLALAAGLALPLLALAGYSPGARDPAALRALVIGYCLLPCVLKICAAATLYFSLVRQGRHP
jgi:GPH family glycoside/pentoside/hexuronide:cation symporter